MNPYPPVPPPYGSVPGGVWPPPPMVAPQQPVYAPPVCGFKWLYRRIPGKAGTKALLSDIREGYLEFDAEGIIIQAQVVPRAEIRTPIIIIACLGGALVAVMANWVMENGMRHPERIGVRWSSIYDICLSNDKKQVCFLYDAPNYKGKIRTFSLALTPNPAFYEMFVQAARHYAPAKVIEGRLRNATPLAVWIVLALMLAGLAGLVIWATLQH